MRHFCTTIVILQAFLGSAQLRASDPEPKPAAAPSSVVTWPDTLAAKRARDFFLAVVAPDDGPMREWQQAYRSPESLQESPLEARVLKARSLTDQAGRVEIGKVEADGNFNVDVIGRSEKFGIWLRFRFVFNPDEPHHLVSMQGTPTGAPDQAPATLEPASTLAKLVEQARERSGAPAIAVAIVKDGRVSEIAAAGVRRIDRPDPVQKDDLFHVGSVGKAMTATMIAKLIDDGSLRWDSKISEVLSDIPTRPEYAAVTLEQLLQHRGGVQPYTEDVSADRMKSLAEGRSPAEQRAAFVAEVLQEAPAAPPGTAMIYSNAGYTVAALMAERVSKKSWEELMTGSLFPALGMRSSGIGWPATPNRPDQPHGHFDNPPNLRVQGLKEYDLGSFIAPAGDVYCTVEDLGKFAAFHLNGLRGQDGWLKPETVRRLHRPPGTERPGYAGGWMVEETAGKSAMHWHDGSAGTFFARMVVYPDDGFAVVGVSNASLCAKMYLDEVVKAARKMNGFAKE